VYKKKARKRIFRDKEKRKNLVLLSSRKRMKEERKRQDEDDAAGEVKAKKPEGKKTSPRILFFPSRKEGKKRTGKLW